MKKIINIILLVILSTPVFSQGFNDSIMNQVLFDEVIAYQGKRNTQGEVYFSKVGAELHSKGSVEYMTKNGCRHRPSHSYLSSLPKNEVIMILNDIGVDTSEYDYIGSGEILARIPIQGQTTYQKVAQIAINGWLNSKGHRGTITQIGKYDGIYILSISSNYNKKTKSVDICLSLFTGYK